MTTLLEERPGRADGADPSAPAHEVVVRVVGEGGHGGSGGSPRYSRRPGFGGFRTVGVLAGLAAIAVAIVLLAQAIGGFHLSLFGTTRVDRSAPVVLEQLRDVSTFTAATGEFEATVDVEDDVALLPSFIAGERTIFIGVGTADAQVDFSNIGTDAVVVGQDGSVTVSLPRPVLATPVVDPARSRVVNRDRGIVNRVGDVFTDNPTSERELYLMAQKRIAAAARASSLRDRAEVNTEKMLRSLLGRVGFDTVNVVFTDRSG